MGQNQSAVSAWKSEVCLAVLSHKPQRLYDLLILASRHEMGLIQITPSNAGGAALDWAHSLIHHIGLTREKEPPVCIDEYLRQMNDTSRGASLYHVFEDPLPTTSTSSSSSSSSSLSRPAVSYLNNLSNSLTSMVMNKMTGHDHNPSTRHAHGSTTISASSYVPPNMMNGSGASHDPLHARLSQNEAPSSSYSPPSSASQPSYSPPTSGASVHSTASPYTLPTHSPITTPQVVAEFSAATLPVSIDTLWIGSDSLLIYAAKQDQTSIIHLLHQAGADLELSDAQGWSALHHAATAGCVRSVKALLDIGSDALAHSKLGLTPSQCTSHPEIRRELEAEEQARRDGVNQQVAAIVTAQLRMPMMSHGNTAYTTAPAQKQSVFHVSLYQIIVPIEVRAGTRFEASYRCPPRHSPSDCLCVYYCDEKTPSSMHARLGRSVPVPDKPPHAGEMFSKVNILADDKMLPPGTYRLVYYNATDATFPAASNLFRVVAVPSARTSTTLSSWFDPANWRDNASSQPIDLTQAASATPIILHPGFQALSELTSENEALYTTPLPPYFLFSFSLNPHAVRLALELDGRLSDLRDRLVPKRLTEKDFWSAYFFLMLRLGILENEDERLRRVDSHLHSEPNAATALLSFQSQANGSSSHDVTSLSDGSFLDDTKRSSSQHTSV